MGETSVAATHVPTESEIELADEIGMALVRLNRAMACIAAQSSKFGMDKSAFILLATLAHGGPLRSSALAEMVHSDPSTISRQVAQLVKDGLVERQADPEDGRATLLAATEAGMTLLAKHRRRRNEAIARMIGDWPEAERQQLAVLFDRFTRSYESSLQTFIAELANEARSGGEN